MRDQVAIFPTYFPGYYLYTLSGCTVGSKEWMPPVDPCDWTSERRLGVCAWQRCKRAGRLALPGPVQDGCPLRRCGMAVSCSTLLAHLAVAPSSC